MVKNLQDLFKKFSDETVCREHLIKQRWPDGNVICQYCGHPKCYRIDGGERFKCANNKCYKRFRVTVGTIFEASNIPLTKWFPAMYLIMNHKKGISSCQLARDLGVTQKTGWFMLHRIREQLKADGSTLLGGIVEIDETFVGGKVGNMNKKKREQNKQTPFAKAPVVELWLKEEFTGNYLHRLMPMTFDYRINLGEELSPTDLAKIWHQSGAETIKTFNDFERGQFGKESPIYISSEDEFLTMVQPVMDWYNSLSPNH